MTRTDSILAMTPGEAANWTTSRLRAARHVFRCEAADARQIGLMQTAARLFLAVAVVQVELDRRGMGS